MTKAYDSYYQTEDLFGRPYPELISFFKSYSQNGKLLDLGCGQGRDALALARLGYSVTGVDSSKVGIDQMLKRAKAENLAISGLVDDIYSFDAFNEFDIVLLDSMFHFTKQDRKKEIAFIKRIILETVPGCLIVFCIQDSGKKVQRLNETIDETKRCKRITDEKFKYVFTDDESGHQSSTDYRMIAIKK
jgi:SAM-dependent methyltransferase